MPKLTRSPFPGMDPYLEEDWPTTHLSLLADLKRVIQPLLPDDLVVRAEQDVELTGASITPWRPRPDLTIREDDAGNGFTTASGADSGAIMTLLPPETEAETAVVYVEPRPHRRLAIREIDAPQNLITAVEVLSPTNKRAGRGSEDYRRKVGDLVEAGVNVVELDFVRYPRTHAIWSPEVLDEVPLTPYYVTVWVPDSRGEFIIYPIPLRSPLPPVRVPLRRGEPPIRVPLQEVAALTYAAAGIRDSRYRTPAVPPLEGEDAAWADGLLRAAGLR